MATKKMKKLPENPEELRSRILDEIAKALRKSGSLAADSGYSRSMSGGSQDDHYSKPGSSVVPTEILDALMSRIDRIKE